MEARVVRILHVFDWNNSGQATHLQPSRFHLSLTNAIHKGLTETVYSADCSNWYMGDFGRNAASWPGLARDFWIATFFPDWSAFNMSGGSSFWPVFALKRKVRSISGSTWLLLLLVGGATIAQGYGRNFRTSATRWL